MKKIYYSFAFLFVAANLLAQEQTVGLSMGENYTNEVYYKLSTQTETVNDISIWDVAFYRESSFDVGIRVNDGAGILVYEVGNTPAGYDEVDVADQSGWAILYNDDTNWNNGAFMQGSAGYGWGEYNPNNHHVEGTIVFVLEYADGTYRKFFIEDFYGGYTFKYSTWDGNAWSADIQETISNSINEDRRFNYYSLIDETEVIAEPAATDWDFVFRRYYTYLDPPGQYYLVSGALHNTGITVAQVEETGDPDPNDLEYGEAMNIIGSDWKSFQGAWVIFSEQKYYVKYENNQVFRIYFTDFGGSSNGNLTFQMEDVSDLLGIGENGKEISFGLFPNPSTDKQVTLVYDQNLETSKTTVSIYDMEGRLVFKNALNETAGFYQQSLDLGGLQAGMYLVRMESGNQRISKKLILQ